MKHTPGPWLIEDSPDKPCRIRAQSNGWDVADVFSTDHPIGKANADLIRVAPDMYLALVEFIEMDIPCPFRGNDGRLKDFAEWYKRVKATLAEARGEVQA